MSMMCLENCNPMELVSPHIGAGLSFPLYYKVAPLVFLLIPITLSCSDVWVGGLGCITDPWSSPPYLPFFFCSFFLPPVPLCRCLTILYSCSSSYFPLYLLSPLALMPYGSHILARSDHPCSPSRPATFLALFPPHPAGFPT